MWSSRAGRVSTHLARLQRDVARRARALPQYVVKPSICPEILDPQYLSKPKILLYLEILNPRYILKPQSLRISRHQLIPAAGHACSAADGGGLADGLREHAGRV